MVIEIFHQELFNKLDVTSIELIERIYFREILLLDLLCAKPQDPIMKHYTVPQIILAFSTKNCFRLIINNKNIVSSKWLQTACGTARWRTA